MNLVSTKIIVPQHIEYFIVDRDLSILEYSANISRFFSLDKSFSTGQDIREILPELSSYQPVIKQILAGEQKYFSLPTINFNSEDKQFSNSESSSCSELYFTIHLNSYQVDNNNCLVIFLEEITNQKYLIQSFNHKIDEYNLLHDVSVLSKQLAQSNYFYERIFTSITEALIITSNTGIIQQINQSTINLLGYSQEDLVDRSINKIIADPNFLLSEIQQYLLAQGELLKNIEVICQTKQGLTKIISFSCSQTTIDNDDIKLIYIGRDITNLKHYQQRQTVQSSVSKILANSQDFTQAAPKILQVICENLNLMVGEIWIAQDITAKQKLKCEAIWTKNPSQFNKFIQITQTSDYEIKADIVGKIWLKNSFCWYNNCSKEFNFARQNIAWELGLKGGFGFTVPGDNNILAVINFFVKTSIKPNKNLADLMLTIANQLGQFIQRKQAETALRYQQEETEKLLLNILPKMIAQQLKNQNRTIADHFESVTILFADLVDFTSLFSQLPPIEIVEILNEIFSEFDRISTKYGLEKIKIIGDAYMIVGGLPEARDDHAEAIAEMALDMQQAIAQFNLETDKTLSIRIGINTGEVVAGVIGTKKFTYDLWGDAVNIAYRMESHGVPNSIQVTASTYQLLKDKYTFQPRGTIEVKGRGEMSTYFLVGRNSTIDNE
ncbi:MAG: adenylate/guanylate cyclase domain-containing protein [Xenococcaceae cyanobacterium MO_188.B29]|nr:adenylate/guanylate cyclase domain-containing protein [Xenococcaceae cyanobacterium MO_188.B29]